MTTKELVERLRSKHCCDASRCNCDEAADEIERLQVDAHQGYRNGTALQAQIGRLRDQLAAMCGWAETLAELNGWERWNANSFWISRDAARAVLGRASVEPSAAPSFAEIYRQQSETKQGGTDALNKPSPVHCPAEAHVKAIDKALGQGWVERLVKNLTVGYRAKEEASEVQHCDDCLLHLEGGGTECICPEKGNS